MNDRVDLHTHSHHSDGVLSPGALVALLAEAGVGLCALTDHDTVAGLAEASAAARTRGVTLVPGIELSARWRGRGVHILGLGIDPAGEPIRHAAANLLALRQARAREIAARLDRAGAPGGAALERLAGHAAPTRMHFARTLVELGAARDLPRAFSRWLGRGRPGHVDAEWPELAATVATITAAGGAAVLAHPSLHAVGRPAPHGWCRSSRAPAAARSRS